jgi:peptide-methionine (S)-S-oxide reductase
MEYSAEYASELVVRRRFVMREGLFRGFLFAGLTLLLGVSAMSAAGRMPIPPAVDDAKLAPSKGTETAVFAGGCFWGTQAVFERVKGVVKTTAGYSGGSAATATYAQVTTEKTGHAESVEVVFDPSRITYGQLLRCSFPSPMILRS